jgi:hypothetical protein
MSETANVVKIPPCDFCGKEAVYDAATRQGPWAFMCTEDWLEYSDQHQLGLGKGQKLQLTTER